MRARRMFSRGGHIGGGSGSPTPPAWSKEEAQVGICGKPPEADDILKIMQNS